MKYFTGYKSNEDIIPLCIKLPQLSGYAKYFGDNNKCMIFLIHNEKLLKTYNVIWVKVSYLIKTSLTVSESIIINT